MPASSSHDGREGGGEFCGQIRNSAQGARTLQRPSERNIRQSLPARRYDVCMYVWRLRPVSWLPDRLNAVRTPTFDLLCFSKQKNYAEYVTPRRLLACMGRKAARKKEGPPSLRSTTRVGGRGNPTTRQGEQQQASSPSPGAQPARAGGGLNQPATAAYALELALSGHAIYLPHTQEVTNIIYHRRWGHE